MDFILVKQLQHPEVPLKIKIHRSVEQLKMTSSLFEPSEQLMYVGLSNGQIHCWRRKNSDAKTLFSKDAELFNFSKQDSHRGDITVLLWQSQMYDGVLISGSADGCVKLWMRDAQFHNKFICCQTIVAHQGTVLAIAASSIANLLATSSTDRLVKIWHQREGRDLLFYPFYECLQTLTEHITTRVLDINSLGTWVASLAWREGDELLLYAADSEGSINIFADKGGSTRFKLDRKSGSVHRLLISCLLIVPQENFMFTAGYDNFLKGLDATNGSEFVAIRNFNKGNFSALAWDNKYHELVAGDEHGFIGIWSAYQERPIYWGSPLKTTHKILKLEMDEESGQLLALTEIQIHVMKINRGQRSHDITGHTGPVISISVQAANQVHRFYSNDKPRFFTASLDNTIRVWDYSDLSTIAVLEAPSHTEITCMCFLPISNLIATGHDSGDIMLWNPELKVNVVLQAADRHTNTVTCVISALYNETEYLVTVGYDAKICIWEVIEKAVAIRQAEIGSSGITVCPTLRMTLSSTAHKTSAKRDYGEELLAVAFHDQGRKSSLVTAGNSCEVQVWDLQNFEYVGRMTGHEDSVTCMAIDQNFLFTGSDDKTIRCWDLTNRFALSVLRGHESSIRGLILIPQTGSLVSCAHDGCLKVWNYQTQSVVKEIIRACALNCLSFLSDSNVLLVGTEESSIITIPIEPKYGNPLGVDNTVNKIQEHLEKKRRQLRGEEVIFSDETRSIRSEDLEEPFPDPVEEYLRDELIGNRKSS